MTIEPDVSHIGVLHMNIHHLNVVEETIAIFLLILQYFITLSKYMNNTNNNIFQLQINKFHIEESLLMGNHHLDVT